MKKVLIIAGGLQVGGAERVAANISKYAPQGEFEFHYIVFEGIDNVYGSEIEENGGTVFTLPSPSSSYKIYIQKLSALMKEHHYVAIHSHTMFNSGIPLFIALLNKIPCRIAHSHTTKTEGKVSWIKTMYQNIMRSIIVLTATDYFACGIQAGYWLFGKRRFDRKGIVINNGIDIDAFRFSAINRENIRKHYNINEKFVIGHSGSLLPVKNQRFLIELLPEIQKIKSDTVLMLLGGGDIENQKKLRKIAEDNGVSDSVIFCGQVMNVFQYLSAFDVFAFPSLREGTPLALLEAQTNGVPCIVSSNVPSDAILTDLVRAISLEDKKEWIKCILNEKRANVEKYPEEIYRAGYSSKSAYNQIYSIYNGDR